MRRPSARNHPQTALWWIRRDLRLEDNQALASALTSAARVIPVFVLDPVLLNGSAHSKKRVAFLFAGLRRLDQDLRARGSRLILRQGPPEEALVKMVVETDAKVVFAEGGLSPYAKRRDEAVARRIRLEMVPGEAILPPWALLKSDGSPRRVFTPFRRAWQALPLPSPGAIPAAPMRLPSVSDIPTIPIPEAKAPEAFPPGEAEARLRLAAFTTGDRPPIHAYSEGRNRLDMDGTSCLSPYFRFGMLSPLRALATARQALSAAPGAQARQGVEDWITQLIWRDFYLHTLDAYPGMLRHPLRPALEHLPWEADRAGLDAWQAGRTGYPIVDAAMRQLSQTGWMPNRARMIVGSFLTKDLLIDWRLGQEWFMGHLVDGDPAANTGGWQWVSGAGTDAAPYFRIFNPVLQGKKFDPDGEYVRRWVPQLGAVPRRYVHDPWRMPLDVQREAACLIGGEYPAPIIDHAQARQRALTAYRAAFGRPGKGRP